MQVLASQLHFLTNRNAELAIPPLFRPINRIKIGGHVALLSNPTDYSLYCACTQAQEALGTRLHDSPENKHGLIACCSRKKCIQKYRGNVSVAFGKQVSKTKLVGQF